MFVTVLALGCSVFPESLPDEELDASAGTGGGDASAGAAGAGLVGGAGAGGTGGVAGGAGGGGGDAGAGGGSGGYSGTAGGAGGVSGGGGAAGVGGAAGSAGTAGGAGGTSGGAGGGGGAGGTGGTPVRTVLVPVGSKWRFWDSGIQQLGWKGAGFNDSNWKEGAAELGYGDGDEATVVGYGSNASNKYVTTWFRHSFVVDNVAKVVSASMEFVRDDGIVIHLNGVEVQRDNMPAGAVTPSTFASMIVADAEESAWHTASVPVATLHTGTNVLAVEVHQQRPESSDISFNFSLAALVQP